MIHSTLNWFRRNAYGVFLQRVLVAIAMATVSVALSLLPYDTILQAIWVIISSLFMASLVLKERLNESDDMRYRRLFRSRFGYLQANDPEALTTVFAENIRPRVLQWFRDEYQVEVQKVKNIDAIDSLAKNGDSPGQLIFRAGIELGQWLQESKDDDDKVNSLEKRLQHYVDENESLLGRQVSPGVYIRHIRNGEARPVGIHMFHNRSRLLFTIEYYDKEEQRHAQALSVKSSLFKDADEAVWNQFVQEVHSGFPCFQPVNGGSGPQKQGIPFFVGAIEDNAPPSDAEFEKRLTKLAGILKLKDDPQLNSESSAPGEESTAEK